MDLLFTLTSMLLTVLFTFGMGHVIWRGLLDIDERKARGFFSTRLPVALPFYAFLAALAISDSFGRVIEKVYIAPTGFGHVLIAKNEDGSVRVTKAPAWGVWKPSHRGEFVKESPVRQRQCSDEVGTVVKIEGTSMQVTARGCAEVTNIEAFYRSNPEATLTMVKRLVNVATLDTLADPKWQHVVERYKAEGPAALHAEGDKLLASHLLALGGLTVEFSNLKVPEIN